MNKQYAIFDLDGTLVDSMPYWKRLAAEFLNSKGITQIPQNVLEQIKPMTIAESAALLFQKFALPGTPGSLATEMNAIMDGQYRTNIPLKPGVKGYLDMLRKNGVRMCVASATAEPLIEACLKRLAVLNYFDFLLSCETVGAGKNKPNVYFAAAARWHASAPETAVYEDALYAAYTAKKTGFYVVGVYDASGDSHWKELRDFADESIRTYSKPSE